MIRSLGAVHNVAQNQQIHHRAECESVYRQIFKLQLQEIEWFIKLYCQSILKNQHQILKDFTYDNDQSTHANYTKYFSKRNLIKLTEHWSHGKSYEECWSKFIIALCPSQYEDRLNDIYFPALVYLQNSLSDQWVVAIQQNKGKEFFESMYHLNDASIRWKLKCHLPDMIARCKAAMATIISTSLLSYPPVRDNHHSSLFWSFKMIWSLIKFIYGVWPSILRHYWKPKEYIDWKYVMSLYGLGPYGIFLGMASFFGSVNPANWVDAYKMNTVTLPWQQLGVGCRLPKIPQPKVFQHPEIEQMKYNPSMNENHVSYKYSSLPLLVLTYLRNKHSDILNKLYNKAKFKNNCSFASRALYNQGYNESIGLIYSNFNELSLVLDRDDEKTIQQSLDELHSFRFDLFSRPIVPGLTWYSREMNDKSYESYIIFHIKNVLNFFVCLCVCVCVCVCVCIVLV